ncbi:MAG: carbohydrate kinase family protein [Kibdelosporangium sp.]
MFDLLVTGDVNPDVIMGPLGGGLEFGQREQLVAAGALVLGGSGAIMACGAARLGLSVAFAGRVGDDDAGRYVRDALASRGVDTRHLAMDPDVSTPLTVVVTREGDRAMLTALGTLADTTVADLPRSRHVHAASYFLMPRLASRLPALFRAARADGATTSLDTNDDPAGRWDLGDVLAETDILLPNAAEAMHLAGVGTPVAAAGILAARGPTVVVKNGADGAICHDGQNLVTVPSADVTPVDTVGAGDSFDAGFVAARLAGLSVADALRLAAACGALSTRAAGGTASQPTWDEAIAYAPREGKSTR